MPWQENNKGSADTDSGQSEEGRHGFGAQGGHRASYRAPQAEGELPVWKLFSHCQRDAGRRGVEPQETDEGTRRQAPQGSIMPLETCLRKGLAQPYHCCWLGKMRFVRSD